MISRWRFAPFLAAQLLGGCGVDRWADIEQPRSFMLEPSSCRHLNPPPGQVMHQARRVVQMFDPRGGETMQSFAKVTGEHDTAVASPIVLYAAYRQSLQAQRALRAAAVSCEQVFRACLHVRIDGTVGSSRADVVSLRRPCSSVTLSLLVLQKQRSMAPVSVKKFWQHLAKVGERLPGL